MQNYNQAQQGTTQLGNVLGLNGPAGNQQALQTLQRSPDWTVAIATGGWRFQ